jgi:uncharacterized protein
MLRILILIIGILSFTLGVIGIFLPVLPTTPFILLAAACFARSSERFHQWILNHKYFGATVKNWEEHKTITKRGKIISITFLNLSIAFSLYILSPNNYLMIFLLITDILVTLYLLSIPSSSHHS